MGKTLYLECASGISGDMTVAALLDLGANEAGLRRALASLGVGGFEIAVTRKQVAGIDACDFDVVLDEEHESHDHDMAWLYGELDGEGEGEHEHHHHEHGMDHDDDDELHRHKHHHHHKHGKHKHDKHRGGHGERVLDHVRHRIHKHVHNQDEHEHDHEHPHTHEHEHSHEHDDSAHHHDHHHHHEHRTPADIAALIDAADLAPRAKVMAHRIFDIVAQAEAQAHGLPIEQVHFHEVGAVDSIVDVVSVAYCLDDLDITDAYVTPLAEGRGRVRCAHGVLPVPVPAVTNIVAAHGLALEQLDRKGELVTPTGAAIAAAVRTMDAPPAAYRIVRVGIGAGKRAYDPPSTVRALVIEAVEAPVATPEPDAAPVAAPKPTPAPQPTDDPQPALGLPDLWKLETEVDDCTGEALGHVSQLLYDAGALEVHYLPVFMKKGRPGYQIEVLCGTSRIEALENVLFENTTTIGIRRCPEWRTALSREAREVETPYGTVRTKVVTLPSGATRAYPEHDSVAACARETGAAYQDIVRSALAALTQQ